MGYALGQGKTLEEAEASLGQVAEGVNTLCQVHQKAEELGVYMPLAEGLHKIIFEGYDVQQLVKSMMMKELRTDVEFMVR